MSTHLSNESELIMYDMFFVSGTTPKPASTDDDPQSSKGQIAVFKIFLRSQEILKVYRKETIFIVGSNFVPSCGLRLFRSGSKCACVSCCTA